MTLMSQAIFNLRATLMMTTSIPRVLQSNRTLASMGLQISLSSCTRSSRLPSTEVGVATIRKIYPRTTRKIWSPAKDIRTASRITGAATETMVDSALRTAEPYSSMTMWTCPVSRTTRRNALTASTTSTATARKQTSRMERKVVARTNRVSGSKIKPRSKKMKTTLYLRLNDATMETLPREMETSRTLTEWILSEGTGERT